MFILLSFSLIYAHGCIGMRWGFWLTVGLRSARYQVIASCFYTNLLIISTCSFKMVMFKVLIRKGKKKKFLHIIFGVWMYLFLHQFALLILSHLACNPFLSNELQLLNLHPSHHAATSNIASFIYLNFSLLFHMSLSCG
jgi:hypothetical protein